MFVPVVDKNQNPLMPTKPSRARKWIKSGKATPFWKNGIFCVRLNVEPSDTELQPIAVGVDPGSKKEGFTVKSECHTFLNIQADAHNKVGKKIAKRRELRRSRRSRKCPNRKNRKNHVASRQRIPAGTRARWDWKLRILDWLSKMFPITYVCVEDIKARPLKGKRRWNASFNPLQVGKEWFYDCIAQRWDLFTIRGFETKEERDRLGLKKTSQKLAGSFYAHCVDSWCIAHAFISGKDVIDNTSVFYISPIPIQRRNLHREKPAKGGIRRRYGGTRCLNTVKNSLVKHVKHGLLRVSGHQKGRLTLSRINSSKQIVLQAKPEDYKILTKLNFAYRN